MIQQQTLHIATRARGLIEITRQVAQVVASGGAKTGLCNVFIQHTSASLIISENADPEVCRDLERFFTRIVPDGDSLFEHDAEGPDDMPAHIRTILTKKLIDDSDCERSPVAGDLARYFSVGASSCCTSENCGGDSDWRNCVNLRSASVVDFSLTLQLRKIAAIANGLRQSERASVCQTTISSEVPQ